MYVYLFTVQGASPHLMPPSSSSASELRAALAQPSKLIEQSLQRSAASAHAQDAPIDARITSSSGGALHSPRDLSTHDGVAPFPLQEPPRSRANSKGSDQQRATPSTPHDLSGRGEPAPLMRYPDMPLGVPPPPGMMQPDITASYHRGQLACVAVWQMQQMQRRMQMDMTRPDVQQMLSAGLLPPQLMAPQPLPPPPQSAAAPGDAARVSVSSHAAVAPQPAHHSPQVSTPLTPQMPIPPVAALPNSQSNDMPPYEMMVALQVRGVLFNARMHPCYLSLLR